MARSIGNTPTPTLSGGGGLAGVFQQAKQQRRQEALDKQKLQQQNLSKFIKEVSVLPEAEQANMIELVSRRPDLEDFMGVTIEGLHKLTTSSTTLAGGRQMGGTAAFPGGVTVPRDVLSPGETIATRTKLAQAKNAEDIAKRNRILLGREKRIESADVSAARIKHRENFGRNVIQPDGSSSREKLTLEESKSILDGTASEELMRSVTSTSAMDKAIEIGEQLAPELGMEPGEMRRLIIGAEFANPLFLSDMNTTIKRQELKDLPLVAETTRFRLESARLERDINIVKWSNLLKKGDTPTFKQREDLLKDRVNITNRALNKIMPIFGSGVTVNVIPLDPTTTGGREQLRAADNAWWGIVPGLGGRAEGKGSGVAQIIELAPGVDAPPIFHVDAIRALFGPTDILSVPVIGELNLIPPGDIELGSTPAAEIMLRSYEDSQGVRMGSFVYTDEKGNEITLSRAQFLNQMVQAHTEHAVVNKLLALELPQEGSRITAAVKPFDPNVRKVADVETGESAERTVLNPLLQEALSEAGLSSRQTIAKMEAELKALQDERTAAAIDELKSLGGGGVAQ